MVTSRLHTLLLLVPVFCASLASDAGDLETQDYKQAALGPGVSAEPIGTAVHIESSDSTAALAAVNLVTSDQQPHPGTRLSLRNASKTADLYIGANDAAQLRAEFASFAAWREADLKCEAISMCVQGVARCSPSQDARQAICPSTYSTPQGERGVLISTTHATFQFPATQASAFVDALDASLEQMKPVQAARDDQ